MSWPKHVPYLEAENIFKGGFEHPEKLDCNCAARWMTELFRFMSPEYLKATDTLRRIVNENEPGTFYTTEDTGPMGSLILWGDDPRNDEDYIASMLNQCFRRLGYRIYFYL
jgi:hypothetical protein